MLRFVGYFKKFKRFICFMNMRAQLACMCIVYMCTMCMPGPLGGQKRVLDPLELEL